MLLEPGVGVLFDLLGLSAAHVVADKLGEFLAAFVSAGASQHGPEICVVQTCRHTAADPVERTQLGLRGDITLLGRFGEPARGFFFVQFDAVALSVAEAQRILRQRVTLFGKLPKLREPGGAAEPGAGLEVGAEASTVCSGPG